MILETRCKAHLKEGIEHCKWALARRDGLRSGKNKILNRWGYVKFFFLKKKKTKTKQNIKKKKKCWCGLRSVMAHFKYRSK